MTNGAWRDGITKLRERLMMCCKTYLCTSSAKWCRWSLQVPQHVQPMGNEGNSCSENLSNTIDNVCLWHIQSAIILLCHSWKQNQEESRKKTPSYHPLIQFCDLIPKTRINPGKLNYTLFILLLLGKSMFCVCFCWRKNTYWIFDIGLNYFIWTHFALDSFEFCSFFLF